jgi:hypothetical protein
MRKLLVVAAIAASAVVGLAGSGSADPDIVGPGGSTPPGNCAAGDGSGQVLWGALAPLYVYNNGRGTEVCIQGVGRAFVDSDENLGILGILDGPDNIQILETNIELPF